MWIEKALGLQENLRLTELHLRQNFESGGNARKLADVGTNKGRKNMGLKKARTLASG